MLNKREILDPDQGPMVMEENLKNRFLMKINGCNRKMNKIKK